MPDYDDLRRKNPLRGPLARLDRERDELAKAWLVRLIERASLDEIKELPTDRLADELPELIGDVLTLASAGGRDADVLPAGARERAARLAGLRGAREHAAAEMSRDLTAIQAAILGSLAKDPDSLDVEGFADLALRLAEAVGLLQSVAVEGLVEQQVHELESLANSDPLTGLSNRRYLQDQLRQALGIFKRYETPFALLVLDVDGLKRVNDSKGHQAGDRALVQVATAMRRTLRTTDTAARIGGDEFCVLATNQTAAAAEPLAQRIADAVDAESGADSPIGISIGVVSCPEHGDDIDALLEMADQAMYRAKAGGLKVALGDPENPELIKVEKTST
ncbi:MAG TPA: GGDEF domain-containing protein [Thermoleophilaceae bacterium]|nr:GGDEF domain-containing protein [Thermoleophilaceae bacterium]